MQEWWKELTINQKVALPSVQVPLFMAERKTKITEQGAHRHQCDFVVCSIKARPPCSPYTAAEELTCSFLDPPISFSDTPNRCWTCCCDCTHWAPQAPDRTGGGLWTPVSHSTYQASVLRSIGELEHSFLVRGILNTGPLGPVVLKFLMQGHLQRALGICTLCLPSFYTLLKELSRYSTSAEGKRNIFVWTYLPGNECLETTSSKLACPMNSVSKII